MNRSASKFLTDCWAIAACLKHCLEEVTGQILYPRSRRALSAPLPMQKHVFTVLESSHYLGLSQHMSSPIEPSEYCGR